MGPVETAYDCDLKGVQGTSDESCFIQYTMTRTDYPELDFEISGPCGPTSGVCRDESSSVNCILTGPAQPKDSPTVEFWIDICAIPVPTTCDISGYWTLEIQLVEDGKRTQTCDETVPFQDPLYCDGPSEQTWTQPPRRRYVEGHACSEQDALDAIEGAMYSTYYFEETESMYWWYYLAWWRY